MNSKKAIDEYGEGNCCPLCSSMKISVKNQYPLIIETDLKSQKQIVFDFEGKRIYHLTNKLLAMLDSNAQHDKQCWYYECRKCGWKSKIFVP